MQKAVADGIEFINKSNPSKAVIALKSFEALVKVADGKATKLIIPSEMQNVASLVASITEVSKVTKEEV